MKKENRGGARVGSGAPLKYGEKTTQVHFSIPLSLVDKVRGLVKSFIESQVNSKNEKL
jgi:hypothetical protein